MSSDQQTFAITALMLALLVCGSIGSWITSGCCYYICACAFPAMNMFVMTRFVAGVAVVLFGSVISFIVITVTYSAGSAAIFVFCFEMLAIYLLTLSALSIYQVPGSSFQSGHTIIMMCIPILFLSPVLTIFVQHDVPMYLSVLTLFLFSLLFGTRKVASGWATWYLNIPVVTDAEVVSCYVKAHDISATGDIMKDLSATGQSRSELHATVVKDFNRHFWNAKTKDPSRCQAFDRLRFHQIFDGWYCRHRRTAMPLPYSSTWNLTLKTGLENITNMQKGLTLHNVFPH